MNYTVTVEITIDADSANEAEHGIAGAIQNMLGSDILTATVIEVVESKA